MSPQPAQAGTIEVERVLAHTRHPAFHFMLLAVTGLCLVIDGFDAQAMGYVVPSVIGEWHVSKAALGPVFSASLVGMLLQTGGVIGTLALGWIIERTGFVRALFVSFVCAALFVLGLVGATRKRGAAKPAAA